MYRVLVLVVVWTFLGTASMAQDVSGSQDHPIMTRYPQSNIVWYDVQNFSPYRIAVGPVAGYNQIDAWNDTKGRLTRIYYELYGERSHGEVYENYKKALIEAGFSLIADGYFKDSSRKLDIGSRKWLGTFFKENPLPTGKGVELLNGSSTSGGSAFLAGMVERAAGTAFIAITITQQRADRVTYLLDIIEIDEVETDLVSVDAEGIGKDIDELGRVVLVGLEFAHNDAKLLPDSRPTLDEIATFLKANGDLRFYVVGHTDGTGDISYNLRLSEQRASAVAQVLSEEYGVAAERLETYGVGPLNPIFTNKVDRGRDRNRRVELVER